MLYTGKESYYNDLSVNICYNQFVTLAGQCCVRSGTDFVHYLYSYLKWPSTRMDAGFDSPFSKAAFVPPVVLLCSECKWFGGVITIKSVDTAAHMLYTNALDITQGKRSKTP
jgi:hypothetical protein